MRQGWPVNRSVEKHALSGHALSGQFIISELRMSAANHTDHFDAGHRVPRVITSRGDSMDDIAIEWLDRLLGGRRELYGVPYLCEGRPGVTPRGKV